MVYSQARTRRAILNLSVAVGAMAVGLTNVQAQDSQDETEYSLEEILVTASKRAQTLQETPISVSVTTGDVLERARMLDISDLQSVVPSLRVTTLQTSANTNFIIRGFGNGANNAGIEPSVGVFIDGVYRSRSAAQIGDLPRLERVEVLRGPQSTLFGKNASAGVVSVVTAAPSYETEGSVEVQYGNYDQRLARGYFTTGLSDTFAVSLSGSVNKRDGYIETTDDNIDDINNRDRWFIRGQALWEPSDTVTFRFIADYSKNDELCCGVTNIINGPTAAAIQALGGEVLDDSDPFAYVSPITEPPVNDIEDFGFSGQVDVDFGAFTLTSITAYRSNESFNDTEPDYTGGRLLDSANNLADIETFTQEIRLQSVGENTLDWMIGGFLFNEDILQVQGLEYGVQARPYLGLLAGGDPNFFDGLEPLLGLAPGSVFSGDTETVETFTQDNTAFSIFGQLDFHITDKLTLTGGLNYTRDKKTVTGSTVNGDAFSSVDLFTANGGLLPTALFGQAFFDATGLAPTPENIGAVEAGAPGTSAAIQAGVNDAITGLQALQFQPQFLAFPNSVQDGETDDDKVTWTARASYQVNDNINVYVSAATGFKSSSWNLSRDARPFARNQAALEQAGLTQVNQSYGTLYAGPEDSTVYEIGLKARFSKGAINIAAFDQTIEGFQSNIFQGTGFVLNNAGEQKTKGIEIDGLWAPSESFQFTFGGTFLDPEFVDFQNAPGPNGTVVDLSGAQPAGIPETSLSLAATYFYNIGDSISGFARADWQYESEVQVVDNIPDVNREVSVFNASIGIELESGFNFSVWGRNLFNDEYFLSAFPGVIQAGTVNGYANVPRMYGITVGYQF